MEGKWLTRVADGAADSVVVPGEEELHEPRRDEAARAGHAYALRRRLHSFRVWLLSIGT
jgi:hypothetical protein